MLKPNTLSLNTNLIHVHMYNIYHLIHIYILQKYIQIHTYIGILFFVEY